MVTVQVIQHCSWTTLVVLSSNSELSLTYSGAWCCQRVLVAMQSFSPPPCFSRTHCLFREALTCPLGVKWSGLQFLHGDLACFGFQAFKFYPVYCLPSCHGCTNRCPFTGCVFVSIHGSLSSLCSLGCCYDYVQLCVDIPYAVCAYLTFHVLIFNW